MTALIAIVTTGMLAALVMGMVGFAFHWLGVHRAQMITAVGTLFVKDERKAFGVGWFVHLVLGSIFAFIYAFIWSYFESPTMLGFMLLGAITGVLHGIVVSILLVIELAEHHPDPSYRKVGFHIALSYVATHLIYGLMVGYMFAVFEQNFGTITQIASWRNGV